MSDPNLSPSPPTVAIADANAYISKMLNGAAAGKLKIVRRLLKKYGIPVDVTNSVGQTALFLASFSGYPKIVEFLLKKGANPNHRCYGDYTPVHGACWNGNTKTLTLLLEAGGDLRLHDSQGRVPRDWSSLRDPFKNRQVLRFIDLLNRITTYYSTRGVKRGKFYYSKHQTFWEAMAAISARGQKHLSIFIEDCPELSTRLDKLGHGKVCLSPDGYFSNTAFIQHIPEHALKGSLTRRTYFNEASTIMERMLWMNTKVTRKRIKDTSSASVGDILIDEANNLCKLSHPHLLQLLGISSLHDVDVINLIFEHIEVGSLFHILHERHLLPHFKRSLDIIIQILDALVYLHDQNFIHCAISSHCIQLVNFHTAKLSNCSYMVPKTDSGQVLKKPLDILHFQDLYHWLAPEIINDEMPHERSDVYGCCAVLWELLTAQIPWSGKTSEQIVFETLRRNNGLIVPVELEPPLDQLLQVGLQLKLEPRDLTLVRMREVLVDKKRSLKGHSRGEILEQTLSSMSPSLLDDSHSSREDVPTKDITIDKTIAPALQDAPLETIKKSQSERHPPWEMNFPKANVLPRQKLTIQEVTQSPQLNPLASSDIHYNPVNKKYLHLVQSMSNVPSTRESVASHLSAGGKSKDSKCERRDPVRPTAINVDHHEHRVLSRPSSTCTLEGDFSAPSCSPAKDKHGDNYAHLSHSQSMTPSVMSACNNLISANRTRNRYSTDHRDKQHSRHQSAANEKILMLQTRTSDIEHHIPKKINSGSVFIPFSHYSVHSSDESMTDTTSSYKSKARTLTIASACAQTKSHTDLPIPDSDKWLTATRETMSATTTTEALQEKYDRRLSRRIWSPQLSSMAASKQNQASARNQATSDIPRVCRAKWRKDGDSETLQQLLDSHLALNPVVAERSQSVGPKYKDMEVQVTCSPRLPRRSASHSSGKDSTTAQNCSSEHQNLELEDLYFDDEFVSSIRGKQHLNLQNKTVPASGNVFHESQMVLGSQATAESDDDDDDETDVSTACSSISFSPGETNVKVITVKAEPGYSCTVSTESTMGQGTHHVRLIRTHLESGQEEVVEEVLHADSVQHHIIVDK